MTIQPAGKISGQPVLTGLTVQDQRRIQEALNSSMSANTRRAYNQAWRRFEAWAANRGRGHTLPATPELVAAFLAELAEEGKSVATLRLTKSAGEIWLPKPVVQSQRPVPPRCNATVRVSGESPA